MTVSYFLSQKSKKNMAELIPYRKGNKWGFCTSDKEIKIECVYDHCWRFSEGLAAVALGGNIFDNNVNWCLSTWSRYLLSPPIQEAFASEKYHNNCPLQKAKGDLLQP